MKIHAFEWRCECGAKHDDVYAESVFPQECECGKTHCFEDVIVAQLPSRPNALLCDDCELESGCIVQPSTDGCEEYRRVELGVGEYTAQDLLRVLAYLSTTIMPNTVGCDTSFIELKCHKCGAIIDATLTQMPHNKQASRWEAGTYKEVRTNYRVAALLDYIDELKKRLTALQDN